MRELNLYKLWEVCNTLSSKESELQEQGIFISFMGNRSNYGEMNFEGFLNYYSFRIDGDEIVVFNNDPVSWEDFSTDDFSYIPVSLLNFSEKELNCWIKDEIKTQLKQQETSKFLEKENLKQQIEILNKRLNTL